MRHEDDQAGIIELSVPDKYIADLRHFLFEYRKCHVTAESMSRLTSCPLPNLLQEECRIAAGFVDALEDLFTIECIILTGSAHVLIQSEVIAITGM